VNRPRRLFSKNSRYSLVSATPNSFSSKCLHHQGQALSRSYGLKLPSSLTKVISIALGFSPHSPESVYSTGWLQNLTKLFLAAWLFPLPSP